MSEIKLVLSPSNAPTRLTQLYVGVEVTGFLAKSTVTLHFFNPTDEEGSGDLELPLPEGAVVCGYAVDVNGAMVDAVIVEKEKARAVFEAEARKVEKPKASIVELVEGNVFKTRITPFPKQGTRIIRVSYVEELHEQIVHTGYTHCSSVYSLPFKTSDKLDWYSIKASVTTTCDKPPTIDCDLGRDTPFVEMPMPGSAPGTEGTTLAGSQRQRFFSLLLTQQKASFSVGLKINITSLKSVCWAAECDSTGGKYFAISDLVAPPPASASSASSSPLSRVAIVWDSSKSRFGTERKLEIDLVTQLIAKLRTVEVDVATFDVLPSKYRSFAIKSGETHEVNYSGGTSLACLKELEKVRTYEAFLVFTDAFDNFGDTNNTLSFYESPHYMISSSTSINIPLMKIWAQRSGGAYFSLKSASDIPTAITSITTPKYSFISAEFDEKFVGEVFPSLPTLVQASKSFKLAGTFKPTKGDDPDSRLQLPDVTTVTLNYGYGSKVVHRQTYLLSVPSERFAIPGSVVARFWAQRKMDELLLFPDDPLATSAITSIGKQFSIVTSNTSLIVLESLDQFLKHNIDPPESLPEIRKEYLEIFDRKKSELKATEEEKIHRILSLWRRRATWLDTVRSSSVGGYVSHHTDGESRDDIDQPWLLQFEVEGFKLTKTIPALPQAAPPVTYSQGLSTAPTTSSWHSGAQVFQVTMRGKTGKSGEQLKLTLTNTGLILTNSSGHVVKDMSLAQLKRWSPTQRTLVLDFGDYEDDYISLATTDGQKISESIAASIDITLKSRKDGLSGTDEDDGEVAIPQSISSMAGKPTSIVTGTAKPITTTITTQLPTLNGRKDAGPPVPTLSGNTVTLVSSDNQQFQVDSNIANMSTTIKNMLEDLGGGGPSFSSSSSSSAGDQIQDPKLVKGQSALPTLTPAVNKASEGRRSLSTDALVAPTTSAPSAPIWKPDGPGSTKSSLSSRLKSKMNKPMEKSTEKAKEEKKSQSAKSGKKAKADEADGEDWSVFGEGEAASDDEKLSVRGKSARQVDRPVAPRKEAEEERKRADDPNVAAEKSAREAAESVARRKAEEETELRRAAERSAREAAESMARRKAEEEVTRAEAYRQRFQEVESGKRKNEAMESARRMAEETASMQVLAEKKAQLEQLGAVRSSKLQEQAGTSGSISEQADLEQTVQRRVQERDQREFTRAEKGAPAAAAAAAAAVRSQRGGAQKDKDRDSERIQIFKTSFRVDPKLSDKDMTFVGASESPPDPKPAPEEIDGLADLEPSSPRSSAAPSDALGDILGLSVPAPIIQAISNETEEAGESLDLGLDLFDSDDLAKPAPRFNSLGPSRATNFAPVSASSVPPQAFASIPAPKSPRLLGTARPASRSSSTNGLPLPQRGLPASSRAMPAPPPPPTDNGDYWSAPSGETTPLPQLTAPPAALFGLIHSTHSTFSDDSGFLQPLAPQGATQPTPFPVRSPVPVSTPAPVAAINRPVPPPLQSPAAQPSKPMVLRVVLVDSTVKSVLVSPTASVLDVTASICSKLGLNRPEEYSLRIGPSQWLPQSESLERVLKGGNEVHLGKKFFCSDSSVERDDPVQLHLLYTQEKQKLQEGRYEASETDVITFAALFAQITYGDYASSKESLRVTSEAPIPPQFSRLVDTAVHREWRTFFGLTEKNGKYRFVQLCRSLKVSTVTSTPVVDPSRAFTNKVGLPALIRKVYDNSTPSPDLSDLSVDRLTISAHNVQACAEMIKFSVPQWLSNASSSTESFLTQFVTEVQTLRSLFVARRIPGFDVAQLSNRASEFLQSITKDFSSTQSYYSLVSYIASALDAIQNDAFDISISTKTLPTNYSLSPLSKSATWAKWHGRQPTTWRAFEVASFSADGPLLHKSLADRRAMMDLKIQSQARQEQTARASKSIQSLLASHNNASAPTFLRHYKAPSSSTSAWVQAMIECDQMLAVPGGASSALRSISSIAEEKHDSVQMLRSLAMWLESKNFYRDAIFIYRRILKLRGEEPQSHRDLSNAILAGIIASLRDDRDVLRNSPLDAEIRSGATSREDILTDKIGESAELLSKVVNSKWDPRFDQIEIVAMTDLGRLGAYSALHPRFSNKFAVATDARTIQNVTADLRVELRWDSDNTDLELHITEPTKERCYSFHNRTQLGGLMSRDMAGGYGPECYTLKKASPGDYSIGVKLFTPKVYQPVTALVDVYTNYAEPTLELHQRYLITLTTGRQSVPVARVTFRE